MNIRNINITRLHPHPQNANVMSPSTMAKLRRHIQKTGRYEPLVVRPHPNRPGHYELINGHHRKQILQALQHKTAACLVWKLDDAETLMLLATINRLGGEDAAGKRLDLIQALKQKMAADAPRLAQWLPEKTGDLNKLFETPPPKIRDAPNLKNMPEALTIFLRAEDKKQVVEALRKMDPDLARALVKIVLK